MLPNIQESKRVTAKPQAFAGTAWLHIGLLAIVVVTLTYPYLKYGLPAGHDSDTHICYQRVLDKQISWDNPYPRWMPSLNEGLGGYIFFVQYPLPYYVAWGIGKVIPNHWGSNVETRTLGLGVVLAAFLGALFSYLWFATFVDRLSALAASGLYMSLPYVVTIDLYMRASVGEVWALSFLPLCFFYIERMSAGWLRSVPGLAVAFSLMLLCHPLTSVLLGPVLVVYAMVRFERRRTISVIVMAMASLAIAFGLAGAYTLPFLSNRPFIHPLNLILNPSDGPNYSPLSQMFSYNGLTFPISTRGWIRLSLAARLLAASVAIFIAVSWYWSRKRSFQVSRAFLAFLSILILAMGSLAGFLPSSGEVPGAPPPMAWLVDQRAKMFLCTFLTLSVALACYWSLRNPIDKRRGNFLVVLSLASYLMMTSWSQLIWRTFHILWGLQFPWRFNVFLVAGTSGLAALAISELKGATRRRRIVSGFVAVALCGLACVQTARTGNFMRAMRFRPPQYVDAKDGALPIYVQGDPRKAVEMKPSEDQKIHVAVDQGVGVASISAVQSRSIQLQARCLTNCMLKLSQFYYPGWRAIAFTRSRITVQPIEPTGLMGVWLQPGEYNLTLEFDRSLPERVGLWLSLICLIAVGALVIANSFSSSLRTLWPRCWYRRKMFATAFASGTVVSSDP